LSKRDHSKIDIQIVKTNKTQAVIGITIGDVNGIGPEVIIKTFSNKKILEQCIPVIYCNKSILNFYKKQLDNNDFNYTVVKDLKNLKPNNLYVVEPWDQIININSGNSDVESAKFAAISLEKAGSDLQEGLIDACVTAPINKDSIQSAGFNFPGQTEFFTSLSSGKESLMLLCSDKMKIGTVTGHLPIKSVSEELTIEKIKSKANILLKSLKKDFGILKPKIAILGLNPHAGENGKIGDDEIKVLNPLIEEMKSEGLLVYGPYPSDGLFGSGNYRKFDGILAMYHDQALIPFKMISFDEGVNFTSGLNLIRTSPDHGTAFDIAGKGMASENSFRQALYMAIDIWRNRENNS
jgi:4-hydroxythreonine-4-phosphate dehydrogenase